jgi:hypothetical protein
LQAAQSAIFLPLSYPLDLPRCSADNGMDDGMKSVTTGYSTLFDSANSFHVISDSAPD